MFKGPVCSDGVDLAVDIGRGQLVEAALPGASPGFLQPVRGRCGGTYKILHAHDHDGRPKNNERFIVDRRGEVARSMICPNWVRAMWASIRRSTWLSDMMNGSIDASTIARYMPHLKIEDSAP
jgi:hypothetical protein